jgi:hypothetical protein
MSIARDDRDRIVELGLDDDDYGPASSWPSWTDSDRWVPTDPPLHRWGHWYRGMDDEEWRWIPTPPAPGPTGPTPEDLEEMAEQCRLRDQLDQIRAAEDAREERKARFGSDD